jgi:cytochrome P450
MTQDSPRGNGGGEQLISFNQNFQELLNYRRTNPGADLMSNLAHGEVDGRSLTDEELIDFYALMLLGSIENTSLFLGGILWRLSWDHELRRRLVKNPQLMRTALDEFLRYYAPGNETRVVTQDLEIGGVQMTKGDRIVITNALVSRDPSQFANPDAFLPDRSPNKHLVLGLGLHRCIGAHLVRVEVNAVMDELLKRMPEFELDLASPPIWISGQTSGFSSVHVTFPPGGGFSSRAGNDASNLASASAG